MALHWAISMGREGGERHKHGGKLLSEQLLHAGLRASMYSNQMCIYNKKSVTRSAVIGHVMSL